LLVGCSKNEPASPAEFLSDTEDLPYWETVGDVQLYDSETIFNLVDGQADAFFAYGFEQVAVRDYENAEGVLVRVEVWQLATPADAYGLFTTSIAGEPADVGNDGDTDPGRRLTFWQDRYYVGVRARPELPSPDLRGFAQAVATALPAGGQRPALLGRLPPEGLVERSPIFFHEEMSIQSELWLGGENLLGLSQETDGVLARYEVGDEVARLLLVEYPGAGAAAAGLGALETGQVDGLATADARGTHLGAVFGELEGAAASTLLTEALSGE
jgi:hypothetical protein